MHPSRIRRHPRRFDPTRCQRILARSERRAQLPHVHAPDFHHGDFELDRIYEVLSADSAVFIAVCDEVISVGLYDDHFLSVHIHARDAHVEVFLSRLLESRLRPASTCFVLDMRRTSEHTDAFLSACSPCTMIKLHLTRDTLSDREQSLFKVCREGSALTESNVMAHNDVLSLIGLVDHRLREMQGCSSRQVA